MTEEQWRSFVLAGTRTAKLATHRRDGRPHVTPVWFLLDETADGVCEIVFTTWHASLKAKALLRDPRFALCMDDQEPPYSYVMFDCTARLTESPEELRYWATRIGARYMGQALADQYGARNSVSGEYLVRATVRNVIAYSGISE
ncbi:PPOX class F420-dependent oxidoreductase [Streptomyces sp. NPDC097941]|uniref:PPOX class F420-dependent oxidoreductase n=1 Tax=Streptomyces sp. NPDC097941 TaxID=3155685 RepID=UPI00331717AF